MQHNTIDGESRQGAPAAEVATSALREVEAAQGRARLQAGLLPAWYGPAAGALLAVYAIVAVRLLETDRILIQQFVVWPVALLAVFGIRRTARRSTGVRRARQGYAVDARAERRKRIVTALVPMVVAACGVGGGCWVLGAGTQTIIVAAAVGLGVGAWGGLARRNAVIRGRLQELA